MEDIANTASIIMSVKRMKDRLVVVVVTAFLLISFLSITSTPLIRTANGDGLFMEELSANFGDRKADLIIKMTPPVVTTDTLQNQNQKPIIQFKLYDPTTKEGL
jgi:hypothetical protein